VVVSIDVMRFDTWGAACVEKRARVERLNQTVCNIDAGLAEEREGVRTRGQGARD